MTRLKQELDGRRLWIHAYANGCPGYVPSERILAEGGYEGGGAMIYYGLPGPYATGVEDRIVSAVRRQLDDSFAAPDAAGTQGIPPLIPQQSLAALHPRTGYVAELMACEPHVASPMAIAFGPDRRLWVAAMIDYPAGMDGDFVAGERLGATIASTGGWSEYTQTLLGRVRLTAGSHRVRVEPAAGSLSGALVDLRTVAFVPAGMPCPIGDTATESPSQSDLDREPVSPE